MCQSSSYPGIQVRASKPQSTPKFQEKYNVYKQEVAVSQHCCSLFLMDCLKIQAIYQRISINEESLFTYCSTLIEDCRVCGKTQ